MKEISLQDLTALRNQTTSLEETASTAKDLATQVETLSPEQRQKIDEIKSNINLLDSQVSVSYGVSAQRNLASFSETILQNVRNKDTGYVGELMSELMFQVKDLDIAGLDAPGSFLDNIPFLNTVNRKLTRFIEKYENLDVQIDRIESKLDTARMEMIKDITMFDTLFQKNLEYFQNLQLYIQAGEEFLAETRQVTLPRLHAEAQASGEPMAAQMVRDFEETINRFEKKIHDLKLSKTLAIQTAPQIRLVQNSDKLLVDKIQTAILQTIPLWKSQIVISLGLVRQKNALELQKSVTETTNKLLEKNSEMLKTNTIAIAKESEEGIVALETLKKVNQDLITTIEETIKIEAEGRTRRTAAEKELLQLENNLKTTLLQTIQ